MPGPMPSVAAAALTAATRKVPRSDSTNANG
jgi:hypothetical protein